MKNTILTIILLLAVSFGAYKFINNTKTVPPVMMEEDTAMVADKGMEQEVMMEDKMSEVPMVDYSEATLAEAHEKGRVVLFFHAVWCSTCKAAIKDINSNFSDLPEDLTIVMVNYDEEDDLKKEYGIFTQHTFVQVDSDGNEIAKWVGGNVATINKNLQ